MFIRHCWIVNIGNTSSYIRGLYKTIEAFRDHGKAGETLSQDLEKANYVINRLNNLGIDVERVCKKIQDDGVAAFVSSFEKLIESLDKKRKTIS